MPYARTVRTGPGATAAQVVYSSRAEAKPVTVGDDLSEARRLLPEGSQVAGTISIVPQPGAIGVFVDLPHGMSGFVDVLNLPRDADRWPQPGQLLRFEVLQHRPGQALAAGPQVPPR